MHIHISPLFRRRPSRAGGAACDYRPRSAASPLHSAHFHPPNKSLRLRRNNVSAAASPISIRLFADRPSCSSSSLKPSDESVRYIFFFFTFQPSSTASYCRRFILALNLNCLHSYFTSCCLCCILKFFFFFFYISQVDQSCFKGPNTREQLQGAATRRAAGG